MGSDWRSDPAFADVGDSVAPVSVAGELCRWYAGLVKERRSKGDPGRAAALSALREWSVAIEADGGRGWVSGNGERLLGLLRDCGVAKDGGEVLSGRALAEECRRVFTPGQGKSAQDCPKDGTGGT